MLGQQRDFGEIRNKLQSLNLDKVEQLQPDEIKATLAELKSTIDTMPSFTAAKIKQAEGVVRDEGTRDAYVDLRGGPMGVAAQQATLEDLGVEQTEANIDRTRGLTDALDAQVELMKRPPIDTTIPGNANIEKELKESDATVSRLRGLKTAAKDDEGNVLSASDVLIPDPATQGFVINEDYLDQLTADDRKNINRLIRAIAKRSDLSDKQLVPQIIGTDENGEQIIRYVTAREDEIMRQKDQDREEAERMQKLKNIQERKTTIDRHINKGYNPMMLQ